MDEYTHFGISGEKGNGHFIAFYLNVAGGVIQEAHCETHGCMWAIQIASATCALIRGREVRKAWLLELKDIDLFVGGIPDGKGDLAGRAIEALQDAIKNEVGEER